MIVVDTNILAHFWLSTDSSELCDKLYQEDPQWAAPLLWRSEFLNVVTLYLRKELIDQAEALRIIEKAELQMKERQFKVNSVQVIHYASRSTCSSYDCEFVSLAHDLDLEFITMDKKILREFPELAKHPKKVISS